MPNEIKPVVSKQNILATVEDILSDTSTRPFDTYVLGPFLIWYGLKSKKMGKWPRRLMVTAGIYQLLYNWKNYRDAYGALQSPDELKRKISEVYSKFEVV